MGEAVNNKLINIIRKTVLESVQGVLTDPDQGLELRPTIRRRLKKYSLSKRISSRSLSEFKKKFS